ncbi:hypothetical protein [Streptomyces sp. CA-111067]|uniref:hypothetical protein n=1 Tax=Streptomyces sp. CA-111067 TaxID=3240046 RepID=UPI003D95D568
MKRRDEGFRHAAISEVEEWTAEPSAPDAWEVPDGPEAPDAPSGQPLVGQQLVGQPPVEPPPAPVRRLRRPGRTPRLIAAAALLGVVAGAGLGYRIQYVRRPTPLPPLTGPVLAQPKGAAPAVPALPAAQDRIAVYDGDLMKELLPTPKGGKQVARQWVSLADYASAYYESGRTFTDLASHDYRRGVLVAWSTGGAHPGYTGVSLTQVRDYVNPYVPELVSKARNEAEDDFGLGPGVSIPGTVGGEVWGSSDTQDDPGDYFQGDEGDSPFEGQGVAQRGNILVECWTTSASPVTTASMLALMKQQLERL